MGGSFLVTGFVGPLQTNEPRQCRRVASLQTQGCIGRTMPGVFACVIVVVAQEFKAAEDALHLDRLLSLASFSWLGLVDCIGPPGGLLQEETDQFVCRFEEGGAHQHFELLHSTPLG